MIKLKRLINVQQNYFLYIKIKIKKGIKRLKNKNYINIFKN